MNNKRRVTPLEVMMVCQKEKEKAPSTVAALVPNGTSFHFTMCGLCPAVAVSPGLLRDQPLGGSLAFRRGKECSFLVHSSKVSTH